jgi:hypothetical protein
LVDRAARDAFDKFLEPLRQATQCVTRDILIADGWKPFEQPHTVSFPRGDAVDLRRDPRLRLEVTHSYRLVPDAGSHGKPRVKTIGYGYEIRDAEDRPVLRYDYHPQSRSRITWPHLHLWRAATTPIDFRKCHMPTGRVSLEAVIRFLIIDLDIETTASRDDCLALLEKLEEDFDNKRTW